MKVLSFSGGRSSAMLLSLVKADLVIFANTGKEAPGTLDFVNNCAKHFDIPIVLKLKPIKRYLKHELKIKDIQSVDMMLGIRFDEPKRYASNRGYAKNLEWYRSMPLYEKKITKQDVFNFWAQMPFDLQINPYEGNCDLCFLKGIEKTLILLHQKPEIARWWMEQETIIGSTFRKTGSIAQYLKMAENYTSLFNEEYDDSIECSCNID